MKYSSTSIVIMVCIGLFLVLVLYWDTHPSAPDQNVEQEKPGITSVQQELLNQIDIRIEIQDMYNEKGRQKTVVFVKNKSTKTLTADLTVWIFTDNKIGSRGFEIFNIKNLKPNLQSYGIMWLRTDVGEGINPKYTWSNISFE
jgi:hypothetical protein